MQASKSVSQAHRSEVLRELLRRCLILTSNAAEYGKVNCIDNRKEMKDFYRSLKGVDIPSCYKVASITRACTFLKSRQKGERRGKPLRHRKALKPMVCITAGFFTTVTGKLFISLGHEKYAAVQLNHYTHRKISEPGTKVKSLTITNDFVSLFYSREVKPISAKRVYGVDRNEKNLTFGGQESVVQVNLSKVVRIRQTTREVVASLKRDDVRVRQELS